VLSGVAMALLEKPSKLAPAETGGFDDGKAAGWV
jgi:hypothetical protein